MEMLCCLNFKRLDELESRQWKRPATPSLRVKRSNPVFKNGAKTWIASLRSQRRFAAKCHHQRRVTLLSYRQSEVVRCGCVFCPRTSHTFFLSNDFLGSGWLQWCRRACRQKT